MFSIILATFASMMIGGMWFGPKTFYPHMMKEMNISEQDQKQRMEQFKPLLHFGIVIASELFLASILYALLQFTNGDIRIVFVMIAFVLISNVKTNIFTFMNLKLYLIQEGQKFVSILVMGLIIMLMM